MGKCLLSICAFACLRLHCHVLCALCVVSLHSVHLCREYTICKCVYFVGAVHCVCTPRRGIHCLPPIALQYLLLILCAVTSHFAYYFTICHLSSHCSAATHTLLPFMLSGRPHDALPLACGFACVKLLYLCHVSLAASFCVPLSCSFAVAPALPLPCCFSLSPCLTLFILPCYSDATFTMSWLRC